MRIFATVGAALVWALWIQFIYLNISLCVLPAQLAEHRYMLAQDNIVELADDIETDDGSLGHTSHLIKRPVVPENTIAETLAVESKTAYRPAANMYPNKLLHDAQMRIHSPPLLHQYKKPC